LRFLADDGGKRLGNKHDASGTGVQDGQVVRVVLATILKRPHGSVRKLRRVDGGLAVSFCAGRMGRLTSSPPQFGQVSPVACAQSWQKVHSKVQIIAARDSGGRSASQHSQLGLSSSK
jgi:hypothetical protein